MGFFGALTLIFVGAKIFGFLAWSWWLVFSPLLAGAIFYLIMGIFLAITGITIDNKL